MFICLFLWEIVILDIMEIVVKNYVCIYVLVFSVKGDVNVYRSCVIM